MWFLFTVHTAVLAVFAVVYPVAAFLEGWSWSNAAVVAAGVVDALFCLSELRGRGGLSGGTTRGDGPSSPAGPPAAASRAGLVWPVVSDVAHAVVIRACGWPVQGTHHLVPQLVYVALFTWGALPRGLWREAAVAAVILVFGALHAAALPIAYHVAGAGLWAGWALLETAGTRVDTANFWNRRATGRLLKWLPVLAVSVMVVLNAVIMVLEPGMQLYAAINLTTLLVLGGILVAQRHALEDVLPECVALTDVARRMSLDSNATEVATVHENASIFFMDMVSFTTCCDKLAPIEIIDMLHSLFEEVDGICSRMDVYKVETIGDCYMAATGVVKCNESSGSPTKSGDTSTNFTWSSADEMVTFAKRVLLRVSELDSPLGGKMRFRAGIASGHVTSGVIGSIRRRFCLFGDTVNVASRMESTAEHDAIRIDSSTYELLSPETRQGFIGPLVTPIKGKGELTVYQLHREDAKGQSKRNRLDLLEKGVPTIKCPLTDTIPAKCH